MEIEHFTWGILALPVMLAVICLVGFLVVKKSGSWAQAIAILLALGLVPVLAAGWMLMARPHEVPLHESKSDYAVSHNTEFDYDPAFDFDSASQSNVDEMSHPIAAASHASVRGGGKTVMPTIALLLIFAVLLIGGIVLLIALLSNEKTRPIGYALLGVGFVGVLLVGLAGVYLMSWDSGSAPFRGSRIVLTPSPIDSHPNPTKIADPEISSGEAIDLSNNQPRPPEPPTGDTTPPATDTDPPPKPAEAADSTDPIIPQPTDVKPAWVDQTDFVAPDGTYETKVSVGPYQTQLECLSRLDAALVKATDQYIQEFLYQGDHMEFPLRLPLDYIYHNVLTGERYTERTSVRSLDGREMVTLHVQMKFSPEVQQVLKQQQKDTVLTGKLWYTGFGTCLLLTGLLTLFSYLKLDTVTKGFYTRRLQFSAGVVILAVMAMGYLLLQGAVVEPLMDGMLPF